MRNCPSCHQDWPDDRFNTRSPDCFRCRSKGIGVAFAGGRSNFNKHTRKEYIDRAFNDAKRNGYEIVPAGNTVFAGGIGTSVPKIKSALETKAS